MASSRTRGVRRTAPRGGVCQLPRAGGSAFSMGGPRGAGRRASGNSGVRAGRHPEPGRSWDRNPPLTVAPAVSKTGDAFPGRQHPHPSEVSGGLWDCPARGAGTQQGPGGRAPHPGPPTHCLLGGDTWQVKHSSRPSAHHGRSGGLCRQPATEQPAPPHHPRVLGLLWGRGGQGREEARVPGGPGGPVSRLRAAAVGGTHRVLRLHPRVAVRGRAGPRQAPRPQSCAEDAVGAVTAVPGNRGSSPLACARPGLQPSPDQWRSNGLSDGQGPSGARVTS